MVLVINDDNDVLGVYESMLRDLGHEPVAMITVESGTDTVREVGADALLVDLQRPDEADYGIRMIEELRAEADMRAFPIILCTAAAEAARKLGPRLDVLDVPVVVKPFTIRELEKTLDAALTRHAEGGESTSSA